MENKKITKAMRNADIIAILEGNKPEYGTSVVEAIEHLRHENELLAKKASAPRKADTAKQVANDGYKAEILSVLSAESGKTVSEIQKLIPSLSEASNQKVASLCRMLKDDGAIRKETIKGRSYFFKA